MGKPAHRYQAVNAAQVEKLLDSDDFIHRERVEDDIPIFTFRVPGERIEGRIRPAKGMDRFDRSRAAVVEYYNFQGEARKVAIRLNKRLRQNIEENHLWGRWVRITYKGSIRGKYPNAEKVYLVEEDKGAITPDFRSTEDGTDKHRKPRERRKVRRPVTDAKRKDQSAAA